MVPWWERWCGYQARTVGLPLLRYACYARLGHQTLLWIKEFFSKISYNYLNAYIFNFFFPSSYLLLQVYPYNFPLLAFNSHDTETDELRAETLQAFCSQG